MKLNVRDPYLRIYIFKEPMGIGLRAMNKLVKSESIWIWTNELMMFHGICWQQEKYQVTPGLSFKLLFAPINILMLIIPRIAYFFHFCPYNNSTDDNS